MDKQVIDRMFKEAPVTKTPTELVCNVCSKVVKVGKYRLGNKPYKCHTCRHPKAGK